MHKNATRRPKNVCKSTDVKPMWQQPDFSVDTNAGAIRTVIFIVEIKYVLSNNVAIHTENCKLEISLDCTPKKSRKPYVRKQGLRNLVASEDL